MAGVAQRIFLAAPTGADGHHEPIGFDDAAVRRLDPHRAGDQYRASWYHAYSSAAQRLSARITTSSARRHPRRSRPVSSSQPARAVNTGPNGIHWDAMTPASRPVE